MSGIALSSRPGFALRFHQIRQDIVDPRQVAFVPQALGLSFAAEGNRTQKVIVLSGYLLP